MQPFKAGSTVVYFELWKISNLIFLKVCSFSLSLLYPQVIKCATLLYSQYSNKDAGLQRWHMLFPLKMKSAVLYY